jgi:putative two-component system response regulator
MSERILVVDDETMNLRMVEHILKSMYEVLCFTSGEEALKWLSQDIPDLILLDLHMPGLNGLEVFEKLKQDERTKDIPVVFLTADT